MEGRKEDIGKPSIDLVPPEWIVSMAKICEYGKNKYGADNWRRGFKWSRLYGAALRHLLSFWEGEDMDKESSFPHLWHAAWNCLALAWYMKHRKPEEDDRWINP
jgi:hypothetical protein